MSLSPGINFPSKLEVKKVGVPNQDKSFSLLLSINGVLQMGSERMIKLAEQLKLLDKKERNITAGDPRSKRAAVLICIFEDEKGDLRVILTKRSSTLSTNAGDVALPGGKRDETDADDIETALREAKEEIGLDPSYVNVVAVLEQIVLKNGTAVVPVVGILSDRRMFIPCLNEAEVEAIFDAPLEMFLKDENRRGEEKEWMGHKYLLHYFDYYEPENGKLFVIWALTAGILITAASIVYHRPPDFLELRPKFWTRQFT